jgi:hypothetical protein
LDFHGGVFIPKDHLKWPNHSVFSWPIDQDQAYFDTLVVSLVSFFRYYLVLYFLVACV